MNIIDFVDRALKFIESETSSMDTDWQVKMRSELVQRLTPAAGSPATTPAAAHGIDESKPAPTPEIVPPGPPKGIDESKPPPTPEGAQGQEKKK